MHRVAHRHWPLELRRLGRVERAGRQRPRRHRRCRQLAGGAEQRHRQGVRGPVVVGSVDVDQLVLTQSLVHDTEATSRDEPSTRIGRQCGLRRAALRVEAAGHDCEGALRFGMRRRRRQREMGAQPVVATHVVERHRHVHEALVDLELQCGLDPGGHLADPGIAEGPLGPPGRTGHLQPCPQRSRFGDHHADVVEPCDGRAVAHGTEVVGVATIPDVDQQAQSLVPVDRERPVVGDPHADRTIGHTPTVVVDTDRTVDRRRLPDRPPESRHGGCVGQHVVFAGAHVEEPHRRLGRVSGDAVEFGQHLGRVEQTEAARVDQEVHVGPCCGAGHRCVVDVTDLVDHHLDPFGCARCRAGDEGQPGRKLPELLGAFELRAHRYRELDEPRATSRRRVHDHRGHRRGGVDRGGGMQVGGELGPLGQSLGDRLGLGEPVAHGEHHVVVRTRTDRVVRRVQQHAVPRLREKCGRPVTGTPEQCTQRLGDPLDAALGPCRRLLHVHPVRRDPHEQIRSRARPQLTRPRGAGFGPCPLRGDVGRQRRDLEMPLVLGGVRLGDHARQCRDRVTVIGAVHPQHRVAVSARRLPGLGTEQFHPADQRGRVRRQTHPVAVATGQELCDHR